jgi:hypothetical protein
MRKQFTQIRIADREYVIASNNLQSEQIQEGHCSIYTNEHGAISLVGAT